jgi:type II secretory ATPase GspE/PulE/Tfp pilus assembly ATPase PilB-like protein
MEVQSGNSPPYTEAPVVHYLQQTWEIAALLRASDIHFEPFETFYRVRLRVDGVLQEIAAPPLDTGAVHASDTDALPGTAVAIVGALGVVAGAGANEPE